MGRLVGRWVGGWMGGCPGERVDGHYTNQMIKHITLSDIGVRP